MARTASMRSPLSAEMRSEGWSSSSLIGRAPDSQRRRTGGRVPARRGREAPPPRWSNPVLYSIGEGVLQKVAGIHIVHPGRRTLANGDRNRNGMAQAT